jgi:hypothetical protein
LPAPVLLAAPVLIYGNEATVQIGNMDRFNEAKGFEMANQHCRQYGRVARINLDQGTRVTFDCVKP